MIMYVWVIPWVEEKAMKTYILLPFHLPFHLPLFLSPPLLNLDATIKGIPPSLRLAGATVLA